MDEYDFGDFILKIDDATRKAFAYKVVDLDADKLDTVPIHDYVYEDDCDCGDCYICEPDCNEDDECL